MSSFAYYDSNNVRVESTQREILDLVRSGVIKPTTRVEFDGNIYNASDFPSLQKIFAENAFDQVGGGTAKQNAAPVESAVSILDDGNSVLRQMRRGVEQGRLSELRGGVDGRGVLLALRNAAWRGPKIAAFALRRVGRGRKSRFKNRLFGVAERMLSEIRRFQRSRKSGRVLVLLRVVPDFQLPDLGFCVADPHDSVFCRERAAFARRRPYRLVAAPWPVPPDLLHVRFSTRPEQIRTRAVRRQAGDVNPRMDKSYDDALI